MKQMQSPCCHVGVLLKTVLTWLSVSRLLLCSGRGKNIGHTRMNPRLNGTHSGAYNKTSPMRSQKSPLNSAGGCRLDLPLDEAPEPVARPNNKPAQLGGGRASAIRMFEEGKFLGVVLWKKARLTQCPAQVPRSELSILAYLRVYTSGPYSRCCLVGVLLKTVLTWFPFGIGTKVDERRGVSRRKEPRWKYEDEPLSECPELGFIQSAYFGL